MKTAYLIAYCHKNFGDDLFVHLLCSRFPQVKFYVEVSQEEEGLSRIPNLVALKESFFQKIKRKICSSYVPFGDVIKKSSATVLIGGSMFIQSDNWRKKLERLKVIKSWSKHFCILGCNFGPFYNAEYLKSYQEFLGSIDDCCFRDMKSYRDFVGNKNARYAFDIAFSASCAYKDVDKRNGVIVSVIDVKKERDLLSYEGQYMDMLKTAISEFLREGLDVTLLSLCAEQGDRKVCEELRQVIGNSQKVQIFSYDGNVNAVLDLFEKSKYVVASRFHAMIIGFLCGCKVHPLSYNEKFSNVLDDLGFDASFYNIASLKKISLGNYLFVPQREKLVLSSQEQFSFLTTLWGS
ncbi:polysaccharide pyruvyl transferase family protein [uncultured Fibrobacter sp.]|uniref:polysaccharide pyruvyl transferase family protein n=1 Tax=uncultured Fibrobacter sp. TaxID=261512 RepID=UPI00260285FD|nr:polysaccharide pyruvyl transferase family protein [uncultured Fibrobacter sp.]